MDMVEILQLAVKEKVSDIFLIAGRPASFRKNGTLYSVNEERLMPEDTKKLIYSIYELAHRKDIEKLEQKGDDDFSFSIQGLSRFRVSTFLQRSSLSAVIRVIAFSLPDPVALGIPEELIHLGDYKKGMILVTGPAGSGKSTSLACVIDYINRTRAAHIITLEDPIEYIHRHQMSIVTQREISQDTESYISALKAALRQSPDVILLGEMRDYETISVAVTAAETGHLIFSTLHTIGASSTINRIIDVFPPNQQKQISLQLSTVLDAVVSQQLVPDKNGGMVPVFEIMTVTPAIRNMIREGKVHQMDSVIYSAGSQMLSMDSSLLKLVSKGVITEKTALMYASNPDMMKKRL